MNLREATALVRLYEACQDEDLRRWALTQVPELGDIAQSKPASAPRYYELTIYGNDKVYALESSIILCRENELEQNKRLYRDKFPLATNVRVEAVPL